MVHSRKARGGVNEVVYLVISTDVLFEKPCQFYRTSTASKEMRYESSRNKRRPYYLRELLEYHSDSGEVQIEGKIEPKYIEQIVLDEIAPVQRLGELNQRFPDYEFVPFELMQPYLN